MTEQGRAALLVSDLIVSEGAENVWAWRYSTRTGEVVTAVDLTTWTARAQFRARIGGAVWWVATDSDNITLGEDGLITLTLPTAETEKEAWWSKSRANGGVWDLELIPTTGKAKRFAMGKVIMSPNATRADGQEPPS